MSEHPKLFKATTSAQSWYTSLQLLAFSLPPFRGGEKAKARIRENKKLILLKSPKLIYAIISGRMVFGKSEYSWGISKSVLY